MQAAPRRVLHTEEAQDRTQYELQLRQGYIPDPVAVSRSPGQPTLPCPYDAHFCVLLPVYCTGSPRTSLTPVPVQVSKLLALAFAASGGEDDGAEPLQGGTLVRYQLKLLAAMQWEASTLGKDFITVLATEAATGELAGVANLSPGLALADAAGHEAGTAGAAAACISNMAVAEVHRRRGLGRRLLAACEQAAREAYAPPASLLGLAVYRSNEAAIALYAGSGFRTDDAWVDPRWAESAERGRVTFARRQLMLKRLEG